MLVIFLAFPSGTSKNAPITSKQIQLVINHNEKQLICRKEK